MIQIGVDDHEIRQALGALKHKLGDATEVMDEIGALVELSIKLNFEDEGRPARWPKSRRALAEGGQTLTSPQARLRNSFGHQAGPFSVVIGTNVQYAAIHHFGGVIRAKNGKALATPFGPRQSVRIPARPFLLLQDQDRVHILNVMRRYLSGG